MADSGDDQIRGDGDDVEPPSSAILFSSTSGSGASWAGPPPWVTGFGRGSRRCSFCDRREASMRYLVRSQRAYICEECVDRAAQTIAAAPPDRKLLRFRARPSLPADRDAAEEEIADTFETAIGGDAPNDERLERIEDGARLELALRQVGERLPPAQRPDLFVESVRFLGEEEAEVRFTLVFPGPGGAQFPDTGYAVLSDGRWKVARETWCNLVGRVGVQCPPE